jgi:hypothetical protein
MGTPVASWSPQGDWAMRQVAKSILQPHEAGGALGDLWEPGEGPAEDKSCMRICDMFHVLESLKRLMKVSQSLKVLHNSGPHGDQGGQMDGGV